VSGDPWPASWSRLLNAGLALLFGGILGVAVWLEPEAAGYGTHQQLGLSTCSILQWTGYPCPMCGMTTTFAAAAEGDLVFALWNQPFGVVLFALTSAALGVGLAELVLPADRWRRIWALVEPREVLLSALFLGGLLIGWLWKLAIFSYPG